MASETTELTFVRCPSCRSLVPASAARCRICNSPLESSAKSDESEAAKSASRVRQNTMSADPNEVAAAIASAHAENAGAHGENGGSTTPPKVEAPQMVSTPVPPTSVHADSPSPSQSTPAQDDAFDPLSAYLEEMDEVVEESPVGGESASLEDPLGLTNGLEEKADEPSVVSLLADLEDDEDSWGVPPTEKQVAKGEPSYSAKPSVETPQATPTDAPPAQTEQRSQPSSGGRDEKRGQAGPAFPRGGEERRGASGGMPRPERGGEQRSEARGDNRSEQRNGEQRNSEQRNGEQRSNEQRSGESRPQKDRPQSMFGGPQPRREERREEKRDERKDERKDERRDAQRSNDRRDERRDERRDGESRDRGARQDDSRQQQPRQGERQHNKAPETQKSENSKLFGWLVSFKSPEGQALELRQGRFFVTASSIKSSDLVIDHESISTPHSLMLVHPERGVLVQDLMSEHGVFVKRGDAGEYKQEEGTIPLRHGDWLKFGKVEYLVALLPYAQK